jgi:biotin operon repressor
MYNKLSQKTYEVMDTFITTSPQKGYHIFLKETGIKISQSCFSRRRSKLLRNKVHGSHHGSKRSGLISILQKSGEVGLSLIEIVKTSKCSKNAVYSQIHYLKKKGYKIEMIDGKYHLLNSSSTELQISQPKYIQQEHAIQHSFDSSKKSVIKEIADLNFSTSEKNDVESYLTRGHFYLNCVQNLILAKKHAKGFLQQVEEQESLKV